MPEQVASNGVPQYSTHPCALGKYALLMKEPGSGHMVVNVETGETVIDNIPGSSGHCRLWADQDQEIYVLVPDGSQVHFLHIESGQNVRSVNVGITAQFGGGEGCFDEQFRYTVLQATNTSSYRVWDLWEDRLGPTRTLEGGPANGILTSKSGDYAVASHAEWTAYELDKDELTLSPLGKIAGGTGHGLPLRFPDGRDCFMSPTSNWDNPGFNDKYQCSLPIADAPLSQSQMAAAQMFEFSWDTSQHWGGWGDVAVLSTYRSNKAVYLVSTGVRNGSFPADAELIANLPNGDGGYNGEPHASVGIEWDGDKYVATRVIWGQYDGSNYSAHMEQIEVVDPPDPPDPAPEPEPDPEEPMAAIDDREAQLQQLQTDGQISNLSRDQVTQVVSETLSYQDSDGDTITESYDADGEPVDIDAD